MDYEAPVFRLAYQTREAPTLLILSLLHPQLASASYWVLYSWQPLGTVDLSVSPCYMRHPDTQAEVQPSIGTLTSSHFSSNSIPRASLVTFSLNQPQNHPRQTILAQRLFLSLTSARPSSICPESISKSF